MRSRPSGFRSPPMARTLLALAPEPASLGEGMKIRSPQIAGVEPLHDGSLTFHFTFSLSDHLEGSPVEADVPLSAGPRHCGQLSSAAATPQSKESARPVVHRFIAAPYLSFWIA